QRDLAIIVSVTQLLTSTNYALISQAASSWNYLRMPEAKEHDYQDRIRAQIAQYANPGGLIQLGPIYHYWIYKHILPGIAQVFGVYDALLFYAQYKVEALRQRGASRRIVSFGGRR